MRLLTYNIHKGIGGRDRRYRLQRIIDVIESQNPDLVCLQEVDQNVRRSKLDDQARLLSSQLHFESLSYQLNVRVQEGGYGNLILSRWPLPERHNISITYRNKKKRGAQLVRVDSPDGELHLINLHLGLAEAERRWQAKHLLQHRLFRALAHLPTVIAGDFNDWRNTLEQNVFLDTFSMATHPPSRLRTFPAWLPVGSLDKVFVNDAILVKRTHAVKNRLSRLASDHLPIVIDFQIRADSDRES